MTVYSGQGRERLITAVAATSDANGLITFRQGPCPLGFVWQGSVTVTNAPSGALFNASVASTPWGQWAGPTNFGPVQLWGNETLIVMGVGLQPSTQYSMLFFGVALPEHMADPLPPVAPLSTVVVETATLIAAAVTVAGGGGNFVIQPPSLTRRLTLVIDGTNKTPSSGGVSVTGVQTGTLYGVSAVVAAGNTSPPTFYAIEPAVDQTYKIQYDGAGSVKIWVLASFTNPLVTTNQNTPLAVVGSLVAGPPILISGSPTTSPFKSLASGVFIVGNNQTAIAAPGAGQSIYVQDVGISGGGPPPVATAVDFHLGGGGAAFAHLQTATGQPTDHQSFPGGFELPANTALQVDVIANSAFVSITYVLGATQ